MSDMSGDFTNCTNTAATAVSVFESIQNAPDPKPEEKLSAGKVYMCVSQEGIQLLEKLVGSRIQNLTPGAKILIEKNVNHAMTLSVIERHAGHDVQKVQSARYKVPGIAKEKTLQELGLSGALKTTVYSQLERGGPRGAGSPQEMRSSPKPPADISRSIADAMAFAAGLKEADRFDQLADEAAEADRLAAEEATLRQKMIDIGFLGLFKR